MADKNSVCANTTASVERSIEILKLPQVGLKSFYIALGLFVLAYIPTLVAQGSQLWARPHYQFFPLAILGSAALAVRAWRGLSDEDLSICSLRSVKTLLWVSFAFLTGGLAMRSGWFGVPSLLTLIIALIFAVGGPTLFRAMIPSLLMLSVLIYPPLRLDGELVLLLRRFAVWASGALLDVAGLPHFVFGNIIEIRGNKLLVEEACSGINSVFFIGAFSLFYGLWRKRSSSRIISLVLASFCFVLLGNVIRIAVGAILKYRYEIDILTGWKHEAAGLIIFSASLGLVWNFDRLLFEFFAPLPARNLKPAQPPKPSETPAQPIEFRAHIARAFPPSGLISSAAVFALVGIVHGALMVTEHRTPGIFAFKSPTLKPSATFSMPDLIEGWVKTTNTQTGPIERENSFNGSPLHSRQWAYKKGRMVLWLSLDYPYTERHDLTVCYKAKGWEFDRSAEFDAVNLPSAVLELNMLQKPLKNGYLTFTQFLGDGGWYTGPLGRRLADRLGHGAVYQVQAVVVRADSLTSQEKLMVREFFQKAKKQLSGQVTAQQEGTT